MCWSRPQLWTARHARLGAVLSVALVAVALLGPWLCQLDPNTSDFVSGCGALGMPVGPCVQHWLGTDTLFRDELSRLLSGARLSLGAGLLATLLSASIGTTVGIVAALAHQTRWRLLDSLLMRTVDAGLAFPYLLVVMAIGAAVDRPGFAPMVLVLGATGWLGMSRVVRAEVLQLRDRDFITAARALGQTRLRIVLRHLVPNLAGPLVVMSSASMASMILAESVLSYLSVGVQPPQASWGSMLREGQVFFTAAPRLVAAPGLAIVLAVLAFNLLGEGLRDALDPRR